MKASLILLMTLFCGVVSGSEQFPSSTNHRRQHQTFNSSPRFRCQTNDNYFNRKYFSLNQVNVIYDQIVPSDWSTTSGDRCRMQRRPLKTYDKRDFVVCLDELSMKRNRRPIHIAFVGDSIVREYFLGLLWLTPEYDRKVQSQSTHLATFYFHEDRNITFPLLDNLLISFYWRNLIQQDLLMDFKRWATTTDHRYAPDYIFLGVMSHHVDRNPVTHSLSQYEQLLEDELMPLIQQSLIAHPDQEIIWLRQSSISDYNGPSGDREGHAIDSEKIHKYNLAVTRILKDTRVIMWDSLNAFTEEYLRACGSHKRSDRHKYLNCNDFIHPGFGALSIGTQLLVNHLETLNPTFEMSLGEDFDYRQCSNVVSLLFGEIETLPEAAPPPLSA